MSGLLDLSEFGSADDVASYAYPVNGTYHLIVAGVEDHPRDDKGAIFGGLKITIQVLAGTVEGQAGREFIQAYFDPSPTAKDGGKFQTKLLAKLALVSGLIDAGAFGRPVQIDWSDLTGRMFIAKVGNYKRKSDRTGKEYEGAEIDGLNMWSVNDPATNGVPKDLEAIAQANDDGGDDAPQAPTNPAPAPAPTKPKQFKSL